MNKKFNIFGLAAIAALLLLNLSYAFDGYGVKTSKLHLEVLAQTNDSVPGSGGGSGTDTVTNKKTTTRYGCTIVYWRQKNGTQVFTYELGTAPPWMKNPDWVVAKPSDAGDKWICDGGPLPVCINIACTKRTSGSST